MKWIDYHVDLWLQIQTQWRRPYEQADATSIFMTPHWIGTWLAIYGPALRPSALLFDTPSGETAGIALLTLRRERVGPFRVRVAYLNATGEGHLCSEHNGVLCLRSSRDYVLDQLVTALHARGVEVLRLYGFCEQDARDLERRWPAGSRRGFFSEDRYVDLRSVRSGPGYLAGLSRNTREQIRRSIRLYEQSLGPLSVQHISAPTAVEAAFEELRQLHETRWQSRGEDGAFSKPQMLAFQRLLRAQSTSQSSEPRVEIVRVCAGATIVGLLYNFVYKGRVTFYQSGFRYEQDGRLKPGMVTHFLAVESYAARGLDEYDFLAGEVEPVQYKVSLGTECRRLAWRELAVPCFKLAVRNAASRARRQLRVAAGSWWKPRPRPRHANASMQEALPRKRARSAPASSQTALQGATRQA